MTLLLLFAVRPGVAGEQASGAASRVVARERSAATVLFFVQPGVGDSFSSARLLESARRPLERRTGFALASAEQSGVSPELLERCPPERRFSCWCGLVRPLADSDRKLLLAVSVIRMGPADLRVAVSAFDLETYGSFRASAASPAELEAEVDRTAIHAPLTAVSTADELEGVLERFVHQQLEPWLKERGEWSPFAELSVVTGAPAELWIDDRAIGVVQPGTTEIAELRAGRRRVELRTLAGGRIAEIVELRAGETRTLALLEAPEPSRPGRTVLQASGVTAGLAGLAVIALAATTASDPLRSVCLARAGGDADCPRFGALTSGYRGADAAPSLDAGAVDRGGLPLLPTGLSLLSLGLGLATDPAWLGVDLSVEAQLGVGVAMALVAFGLTGALSP